MSLDRASGIRKGQQRNLLKGSRSAVTSPTYLQKSSKSRCFHFRYLELCRAKNLTPVSEIRKKSNANTLLDVFADKLNVTDWLMVIEALQHDIVLQNLVLHMRRSYQNNIIEPIDTENRARLFRERPVVFTRFIFSGLVKSIADCVSNNKNIKVLKLEGLPLYDGYIECIAKSLVANDCLETLSFRSSSIGDKGCEMVCHTVKYLNRIAYFDLCECKITSKGAKHVAEMIKMQKISHYTEGWEKSLRYRDVDVNSILGLRTILLANNPMIGDEGLRLIAEVLKEDVWINSVDMQGCGLTDIGANLIIDCLKLNTTIGEFNVRHNQGISHFLQRSIREHLGIPDFEKKKEPEYDLSCFNGLHSLPKGQKFTVRQVVLHVKRLEQELSFERTLRKKAEKLNVRLSNQLMNCNSHMISDKITDASLSQVVNEYMEMKEALIESPTYRQTEFGKLVNSVVTTPETTPRSDLSTLRKDIPHLQLSSQYKTQETQYSSRHEEEQSELEPMEVSPREEEQSPRRTLLQVRKVRSEMKYEEQNVKNVNKKHESKSDHEFANESHFKLNAKLQFEQDIGDGVLVYANQQGRDRYVGVGNGTDTSNYDSEVRAKRDDEERCRYENKQFGDGAGISNPNFSQILANYRDVDGYVPQLISQRERKPEASQEPSKETLPDSGFNLSDAHNHMNELREQVETYMGLLGARSSNTLADGSGSGTGLQPQVPNPDMFVQMSISPDMPVFRRRRQSETVMDKDAKLSPRTAYLLLKKKNREATF